MIFFYRCKDCDLEFSKVITGNEPTPSCVYCGSSNVKRIRVKRRKADIWIEEKELIKK